MEYQTGETGTKKTEWIQADRIILRDVFHSKLGFNIRGYTIPLDLSGKGDYQLAGMVDQLTQVCINRSTDSSRCKIIEDIWQLLVTPSRVYYNLLENNDFETYISEMKQPGTYSNHFTCKRLLKCFNVQLAFMPSMGTEGTRRISPLGKNDFNSILLLGHLGELTGCTMWALKHPPDVWTC